jgi:hypothetical protein
MVLFKDTEEYAQMVERISQLEDIVHCLEEDFCTLSDYVNDVIENLRNVGEV